MTMMELMDMFPDNHTAEKWFESRIWRDGRVCGRCGGSKTCKATHPTMPYWCSACRKYFSVKLGTVMERSHISYRQWAIVTYQFATNVKGISSMKIHHDLGISQSSAWFMVQRLRESWKTLAGTDKMEGPVEIDEVYIGGREKNKHHTKKRPHSQGGAGKQAVVGVKDRDTGDIRAEPVSDTTADTLGGFVDENVKAYAVKYTDDNSAYHNLTNHHTVNHSAGEYVRDMAHVNGIESFWALLKRGYHGVFHHVSFKHLHRYVNEFAGRLNIRDMDTIDMMGSIVCGMVGKRLMYKSLVV